MKRIRSERIKGIKIGGVVTDVKKNKWFTFDIKTKNRDFREELQEIRPRSQKIENGKDKYFKSPYFTGTHIHLIYLNWESVKGFYKDLENNLPYEILDVNGSLIYRQSIIKRKEDLLNKLEKTAIEEGLRNID